MGTAEKRSGMTLKDITIQKEVVDGAERLVVRDSAGREVPGVLQVQFNASAQNGFSPLAKITQYRGLSFKGDAEVFQKILLSSVEKAMLHKVLSDPSYPAEYRTAARGLLDQGV